MKCGRIHLRIRFASSCRQKTRVNGNWTQQQNNNFWLAQSAALYILRFFLWCYFNFVVGSDAVKIMAENRERRR